jgi:transposase
MRQNRFVLRVTDEQRSELRKWAASRTLQTGDGFRARWILALADGPTYSQIMAWLQTTAPTISRGKQRFEEEGIAGLDPRHKGRQPRLYRNPPQHAVVFCVEEKTTIQALDRLDPVLPWSPGRAERHGFKYYVTVRSSGCRDR